MSNPYSEKPSYAFWERAVPEAVALDMDLAVGSGFSIASDDAVATAGSCFAQNIARTLVGQGFNYLVTEASPATVGAKDEGYSVYSARFGNVYTVRQLLQLFDRAYALFRPQDASWHGKRGGLVDPFRPRIQEGGFESLEALEADRASHLAAVRKMFETCSVFIFTLGLTEGWVSTVDGATLPLAPGVGGTPDDPSAYAFRNFRAGEMTVDLNEFLGKLKAVNPSVRVILTVSPVPLIATFEDRHVAVSTAYSKAALRVVAEEASVGHGWVSYFPSYEIVTAHFAGNVFEADQRNVSPEGVARVMNVFRKHYMSGSSDGAPVASVERAGVRVTDEDRRRFKAIDGIICDEEAIVSEMGAA